jgi:hypothetical protein
MRRSIWIFTVLLIAIPVFAQDDAPGDGGFGGGGGAGQAQVFTRVDSVNPIDQVKSFLTKAHITLSDDQEKTLKPAAEAAFKQMQETTERMAAQSGGGRGGGERGQAAQGGQRRGGFGGNGGGERAGGRGAPNNALIAELRRINDDLMSKINAVLKPDQQATLKKFQSDEIKKAGGLAALKLVMEDAGAALTPEQEQQIQTFYAEDAQQRIQLARESQGRPDPAKAADLEKITMAKIVKLLNPAQRKALLDSRTKSQTP